jgi:proteic killer suppression protein
MNTSNQIRSAPSIFAERRSRRSELFLPKARRRCCVARNTLVSAMIQSFRHKGLRRFFESGSVAGIQPHHAQRLRMQLAALDTAFTLDDMSVPGFRLHPLKGAERGRWSIWVNAHCRLTFEFRDGQAFAVDYEDYR